MMNFFVFVSAAMFLHMAYKIGGFLLYVCKMEDIRGELEFEINDKCFTLKCWYVVSIVGLLVFWGLSLLFYLVDISI